MAALQPSIMRPHERQPNPVRVTLFLSKPTDSQAVAMVAYEDGTYDILRNGIPITPNAWKDLRNLSAPARRRATLPELDDNLDGALESPAGFSRIHVYRIACYCCRLSSVSRHARKGDITVKTFSIFSLILLLLTGCQSAQNVPAPVVAAYDPSTSTSRISSPISGSCATMRIARR